jgi:EAL domain-containing protein (putative c-di-GMP-specific phosphodiesterase class I)
MRIPTARTRNVMTDRRAASIADFIDDPDDGAGTDASLRRMLRAIRTHLGMDVAFVSQFVEGRRAFRSVDAALPTPLQEGASDPIDEGFCGLVVSGHLPELMRDAAEVPAAAALPVTAAFPIGAHLSVPVRLADGSVYGTFCCFSLTPDPSLTERDLALLRVFAEMAAEQIDRERATTRAHDAARRRIDAAVADGSISTVFQPIVELQGFDVVGFEALSRFATPPLRPPDAWFAEAATIGASVVPEVVAVTTALAALERLERHHFLTINVSPETILTADLERVLDEHPLHRVILEVTEHAAVFEYANLARALAPLRARGLRIAIDDAGAGHASFRHVVDMAPNVIKLDMSITRGIDTDRGRRALAAALIGFARETGAQIFAEGVETAAELAVLRELRIDGAQGYLIGRPMPCHEAVAWAARASGRGHAYPATIG